MRMQLLFKSLAHRGSRVWPPTGRSRAPAEAGRPSAFALMKRLEGTWFREAETRRPRRSSS